MQKKGPGPFFHSFSIFFLVNVIVSAARLSLMVIVSVIAGEVWQSIKKNLFP